MVSPCWLKGVAPAFFVHGEKVAWLTLAIVLALRWGEKQATRTNTYCLLYEWFVSHWIYGPVRISSVPVYSCALRADHAMYTRNGIIHTAGPQKYNYNSRSVFMKCANMGNDQDVNRCRTKNKLVESNRISAVCRRDRIGAVCRRENVTAAIPPFPPLVGV